MDPRALIQAALEVRLQAYAPYSKFLVGAALLAESGQIYSGCNVENASYGLTNCAERSAVFQAVACGETRFTHLAVATVGGGLPCGACLQVLAEFCQDLEILIVDVNAPDRVTERRLSDLLPHRFRL